MHTHIYMYIYNGNCCSGPPQKFFKVGASVMQNYCYPLFTVHKALKDLKDSISVIPCAYRLNKCVCTEFYIQTFKCHTMLFLLKCVL